MPETTYEKHTSGKCPHCQHVVYFGASDTYIKGQRFSSELLTLSGEDLVHVFSSKCPNCKKPIVTARTEIEGRVQLRLVHPFNIVRTVPPEVPKSLREDFLEAAAVLPISEKASAALSRRCLQNVLTEAGYKQKNLNDQIDAALEDLPTRIAENLDVIRQIGNYAAHPMKHQSTGLIVDVEPEEARWTLEVLEGLFDYYYVAPKREAKKRKELEKKLKSIGKPPLKKP